MTFVKLDCGVLDSSLWVESAEVRVVFVTMLAMADSEGLVEATAPGIARRANLPLATTRRALRRLEAPDPDDRSGVEVGRRIKRVAGGYLLVNYLRYRAKDHTAAERKRRQRERERDVSRVTSQPVTQAEAEAEAEEKRTDSRRSASGDSPATVTVKAAVETNDGAGKVVRVSPSEVLAPGSWPSDWTDRLVKVWGESGTIGHGKLGGLVKPLQGKHALEDIELGLRAYLAAGNAKFGIQKFVETAGEWCGGKGQIPQRGFESKAAALDRKVANLTRGGGS